MLHAYVVRAPCAHATFTIGDTQNAASAKGVHLVLTASDVAGLKPMPCRTLFPQPNGKPITAREIPVLCKDIVRHVGEGVALIVADSVDEAKDAAELLEIEYELLDAVVDMNSALKNDGLLVHAQSSSNLAYFEFVGDREKTQKAFDKATHISEINIINNRLVCNYMEPRSCLANWDPNWQRSDGGDPGRFDVVVCSQGVHSIRAILSEIMGLEKIRSTLSHAMLAVDLAPKYLPIVNTPWLWRPQEGLGAR